MSSKNRLDTHVLKRLLDMMATSTSTGTTDTSIVSRALCRAWNRAADVVWMGAKSVVDKSCYLVAISLGIPALCLILHIALEEFLVSTELGSRCLLASKRLVARSTNQVACQTYFKFKVSLRKLLFATVMRPFPNAPGDDDSLSAHYMYETLVEAPIVEELYCRFFFLSGCRTLVRLCLPDHPNTRPMMRLFFEPTPWALATSGIFGLIHIVHYAGRLERIALTAGSCCLESRFNVNTRLLRRREAVHILTDAINQCLKAFCVSMVVLTPMYEQHGLGASIAAHGLWNLCAVLVKIVSQLVMGPRRRGHLQGMNIA